MSAETPAVALWDAPVWANARFVDEGAIEHCRAMGAVGPIEGEDQLTVEVVQRDELNLDLEPASITRLPAQIRLGGMRMEPVCVRELATLLLCAVDVIDPHPTAPVG